MLKSCRKCRQEKETNNFPKMAIWKYWVGTTCFDCSTKKTYEIKRTPINKIGKRTKARISQNGTELDLFARIWKNRPHICQVCNKTILEPKNYCFPHILAKGMYPAYRYFENNIALVCSIDCHNEFDSLILKKYTKREMEEIIKDWKCISL